MAYELQPGFTGLGEGLGVMGLGDGLGVVGGGGGEPLQAPKGVWQPVPQ
jgi:hypothetical protein